MSDVHKLSPHKFSKFEPNSIAIITIDSCIYNYYLDKDNQLSLIEETPTFKLISKSDKYQIENYALSHKIDIKPLYSTDFHISLNFINKPLHFTFDNYNIIINEKYKVGGEAVIYKATLNNIPVIIKTYCKGPRTLRAIPQEINIYLPKKYLLFKDTSRAYFIIMESLENIKYSKKIFEQSMHFLNLMESLNEIHGDISPGNILQDKEGNLKVIDFARNGSFGTTFYSKKNSDRKAFARVLLGYKYADLIRRCINDDVVRSHEDSFMFFSRLKVLYHFYQKNIPNATEEQFFTWFRELIILDEESVILLKMAI